MPRQGIEYSIKGIKAQFQVSSKQWLVKSKDKEYYFKNVIEMVEQFPELLKLDRISFMVSNKTKLRPRKFKVHNPTIIEIPKNVHLQKTERCYYCSGSGVTVTGFKCQNCKGKGEIIVTATLY